MGLSSPGDLSPSFLPAWVSHNPDPSFDVDAELGFHDEWGTSHYGIILSYLTDTPPRFRLCLILKSILTTISVGVDTLSPSRRVLLRDRVSDIIDYLSQLMVPFDLECDRRFAHPLAFGPEAPPSHPQPFVH